MVTTRISVSRPGRRGRGVGRGSQDEQEQAQTGTRTRAGRPIPSMSNRKRRADGSYSRDEGAGTSGTAETIGDTLPPIDTGDESAPADEPTEGPFEGGPEDISLLVTYPTHIAPAIWRGEEREILKANSHNWKSNLGLLHNWPAPVQEIVTRFGLAPLVASTYANCDRTLLTAFVERWHPDTNSFHLPFGEMTITLDDVSSIMHLSVSGHFVSPGPINQQTAIDCLVQLLGTPLDVAVEEIVVVNKGKSVVRFSWLIERIGVMLGADPPRHDCTARGIMLYMLGTCLFPNKRFTTIGVQFLELFRDVDDPMSYAWGASTLAYLYDQLREASRKNTKQLSGPVCLVQAWIHEHFPKVGMFVMNRNYREELPCIKKWKPQCSTDDLLEDYKVSIDQITIDDICWMPYESHRAYRPFEHVPYFSGYIRGDRSMQLHLPERVVRQFGLVQGIPRSPQIFKSNPLSPYEMDQMFFDWNAHTFDYTTCPRAEVRAQTAVGYMEWYHRYSHPYLLPSTVRVCQDIIPPHPLRAHRNPLSIRLEERLKMIGHKLRNMITGENSCTCGALDVVKINECVTLAEADPNTHPIIHTFSRRGRGAGRGH